VPRLRRAMACGTDRDIEDRNSPTIRDRPLQANPPSFAFPFSSSQLCSQGIPRGAPGSAPRAPAKAAPACRPRYWHGHHYRRCHRSGRPAAPRASPRTKPSAPQPQEAPRHRLFAQQLGLAASREPVRQGRRVCPGHRPASRQSDEILFQSWYRIACRRLPAPCRAWTSQQQVSTVSPPISVKSVTHGSSLLHAFGA
jgi:hypothetical protein